MKVIAVLLVLALLSAPAAALEAPYRGPDIALQKKKVAEFSDLIGSWRGEGWVITPDGARHEFLQTEEVRSLLGGLIVTIHGVGTEKGAAPNAAPAHEAFATIAFDEASSSYKFRSFANGYYGEFAIEPTAAGFKWATPFARYESSVRNGVWTEKGYRAGPAGDIQIFEMTIRLAK